MAAKKKRTKKEAAQKQSVNRKAADSGLGSPDGGQADSETEESSDASFQDRRLELATRLFCAWLAGGGTRDRPLDDPLYDVALVGALRRAEMILENPAEDRRLVHAEQLFHPDDYFNRNEIAQRFDDFGWKGFRTSSDRHHLMNQAVDWLREHDAIIGAASQDVQDVEFQFLTAMLDYCSNRVRQNAPGIPLTTRLEKFIGKLRDSAGKELFIREQGEASGSPLAEACVSDYRSRLIHWFLGNEKPACIKRKTKAGHRFRPYALFRYIRLHHAPGPDADDLLDQLTVERGQLSPNKTPRTLEDRTGGFPGFDDKLGYVNYDF